MTTRQQRGQSFAALHQRGSAFLIPNPWDVGTARLLAAMGFEALATTSAGYALSIGKLDGAVGREAMIAHVAEIAAATELPVNADLENGFGDAPEFAAETIRLAADAGAAGGSIEDSTGRADDPIYAIEFAAERVRAAVEVTKGLSVPFVLTARAENYITGRPDLGDTIRRLQAFQEAGADVLYAPGLIRKEDIAEVLRSVDRPVNVLAGIKGFSLSRAELAAMGVCRVSVGGSLARAALGGFLRAAQEMQERGTFSYLDEAANYSDVAALLRK